MPLFRSNSSVILFIHIPKTGGSSIEKAIASMGAKVALLSARTLGYSKCTPQHLHAEISKALFKEGFYDCSFTVCRNPFYRLRSEYLMRTRGQNTPVNFDIWLKATLDRYDNNEYLFDNHIRPQTEFLLDNVKVFRFEDGLKPAVDFAVEQLSLPVTSTIPHLRESENKVTIASAESILRIKEFYRNDFEVLGYDDSGKTPFYIE